MPGFMMLPAACIRSLLRKTASSVLCLLLLFIIVSTASAFSVTTSEATDKVVRWPTPDFSYWVNLPGSDNISDGSDIEAIHDAFDAWAEVGCSAMSITYEGATGNMNLLNGAAPNGQNELVWVEDSAWSFGKYVLGITAPLFNFTGAVFEADIAFNGYLNKWSTTGSWNKIDVESIAIHEIGHALGVQHNLSGGPVNDPYTMAPLWDGTTHQRTLETDDELALCFLYPAGGVYSCAQESDCPYVLVMDENGDESYDGKFACESGTCVLNDVPAESKSIGEECVSSAECLGDLFCQPLVAGGSLCTHLCEPGVVGTCEEGFSCASFGGDQGGACIPGGSSLNPLGTECSASEECTSGLCAVHPMTGTTACQNPCSVSVNNCGFGKICVAGLNSGSDAGACWPVSDLGGVNKFDDEPCEADFQCKSGLCVADPETGESFCRSPCDPSLDNCSAGTWCIALSDEQGACLPGEAPPPPPLAVLGASCTADEECESNMCFHSAGAPFGICSEPCLLDEGACPSGFECVGYGHVTEGACLPQAGALTSTCSMWSDCSSQLCVFLGETGICTQACGHDGVCPCEMSCEEISGAGPICLPSPLAPSCEGEEPEPECGEDLDCLSGVCVAGLCEEESVDLPGEDGDEAAEPIPVIPEIPDPLVLGEGGGEGGCSTQDAPLSRTFPLFTLMGLVLLCVKRRFSVE